eukprot:3964571-Pleurochrysis_carterae.AAC.1
MEDEERENFHVSSGVHVNGDYQGARGDPRYEPVRKPAIVRKGAAWEGVNIAPGQEQHRTPKVTCKFCCKTFAATHVRVEAHFLGLGNIRPCT